MKGKVEESTSPEIKRKGGGESLLRTSGPAAIINAAENAGLTSQYDKTKRASPAKNRGEKEKKSGNTLSVSQPSSSSLKTLPGGNERTLASQRGKGVGLGGKRGGKKDPGKPAARAMFRYHHQFRGLRRGLKNNGGQRPKKQ